MSGDLKPCPNPRCESSDVAIQNLADVHWAQCQVCYMTGPQADSEEMAGTFWDALPRATAGEGMREALKNAECGMTINEVLANYRAIRRAADVQAALAEMA